MCVVKFQEMKSAMYLLSEMYAKCESEIRRGGGIYLENGNQALHNATLFITLRGGLSNQSLCGFVFLGVDDWCIVSI